MTVVRNSRGNQYDENHRTNVIIHQQTEMMDKQECILPKQKENKKETEKRT